MNLLNLIESTNVGFDNLRALLQAVKTGNDAVLMLGNEPITLERNEVRWLYGRYKAYLNAGRQEEFIDHLSDPVMFDKHMRQLRDMLDRQRNFKGSVPGERNVTEADSDMHDLSPEAVGKLNWERMLRAYINNMPYAEFEFNRNEKLTLYRTQIYAILKFFGFIKPGQKVKIIYNTFSDKMATVEFVDKLRQKGLIPKKTPPAVNMGNQPSDKAQMNLPGVPPAPKVEEATGQKKNSDKELDRDTAVSPSVKRALQLMRARQPAARSDIEALVKDELDKQERTDQEIEDLRQQTKSQQSNLEKMALVVQQQSQELDAIKSASATPAPTPAVSAPVPSAVPMMPATDAGVIPPVQTPTTLEPKTAEPQDANEPRVVEPSIEPADEPEVLEPVAKRQIKRRKKPSQLAPPIDVPSIEVPQPDTVIGLPPPRELVGALQGLDANLLPADYNIIPFPNRSGKKKQQTRRPAGKKTGTYNEEIIDEAGSMEDQLQAWLQNRFPQAAGKATVPTAPAAQEPEMDIPDSLPEIQKRKAQLDKLISLKEKIDALVLRAQNVPGGLTPGLAADIENEELYPIPRNDQQYQALLDKYTQDLEKLQKFIQLKRSLYRRESIEEDHRELHIGDPVIVVGNVNFEGKTGDVSGFGRDKNFVIVDLYNYGKHAFHASNVKYNDYADEDDYKDER